ncbi:MAG: 3-hydroxyacyl-CoA dehydrogenase NAD-binding domain-containing protein [Eubacteriales bacterium]|nr:3-hydroxyacyl-CoA dehydrogenase NAD-binding domain-containing protein [Eubacteriales bacterium]MDD4323570.1 3-hydroxyacyl-CoA dehydrogenase NAD-binding domain-containing protein [Eubacteriales bacterium]MDD4541089.1 3-hydroxyacyl-CoA dehydrogenase NAD-binding domain-containing protein [Eubacteriales bacterium]
MMKIFLAGTGTMGSGIAQVFAQYGNEVYMYDREMSFVDRGYAMVEKQLNRQVEKGRMTAEEIASTLSLLNRTETLEDAADCDMVIEAIFEDMDAKHDLFRKLDKICRPDCLFCSNTSSLSITEMAHGLDHEDQFLGFHFFNPAPVMKLVEIVKGANTAPESIERAKKIALAIEKEAVEVKESPGFIVNRILVPMINEACDLYYQGVASAEDIDTAMRFGANHPMGPLALGDLIGLDVVLDIMNILYEETGDPKYRASLQLKSMVRAGNLGRKSGKGFYNYKK